MSLSSSKILKNEKTKELQKSLDKNKQISLSIVVPTINSEKFIRKTISTIYSYVNEKQFIKDFEIILSAQESYDNTFRVVKELEEEIPKVNYVLSKEKGKGVGITKGIVHSKFEWIMFLDDDMAYPIEFLERAFPFLNKYSVVIGSRNLRNTSKAPLQRKIVSKGYLTLVKLFFGLKNTDVQAGIKIFNKKVFERIPLPKEKGFLWDTEFLYYLKKARIPVKEVPVEFNYVKNQIKIVKHSIRMFLQLIGLFYRERIKRKNAYKIKT